MRARALLGVGLGTLVLAPGCRECPEGLQVPVVNLVDVGATPALNAVMTSFPSFEVAVGDGGVVLFHDLERFTPTTASLRDITVHQRDGREVGWLVIGDAGTVLRTSDEGRSWEQLDPGTTANLHALVRVRDMVVVVGDGVVVRTPDNGDTWTSDDIEGAPVLLDVAPLEGDRFIAVGRDGAALEYAGGSWAPINVPTTADLLVVDRGTEHVSVGGAGGLLLRREWGAAAWDTVELPTTADIIGVYDLSFATYLVDAMGGIFYRTEDAEAWRTIDYGPPLPFLAADGSTAVLGSTGVDNLISAVGASDTIVNVRHEYASKDACTEG